MRDSYPEFQARNAEVLAIAPHAADNVADFAEANDLPFPTLSDPDREVFRQYDVKSAMVSLGQRPGLFIVDRDGVVRYSHLGFQQWEIPTIEETLRQLDALG